MSQEYTVNINSSALSGDLVELGKAISYYLLAISLKEAANT